MHQQYAGLPEKNKKKVFEDIQTIIETVLQLEYKDEENP